MNQIPKDLAATLVDPAAYANDTVHETYRWLRENQPIGKAELDGFDPFWVVSKHEDILDISKRNADFPSGARSTVIAEQSHIERVREITGGSDNLVQSLVTLDGREHKKYRGLTQAWFMPGSVRKREEAISNLARDTVDKMAKLGGSCDFVEDVALAYPLQVVMEILGVDEADYPVMLKLTQTMFGPQDPDVKAVTDALSASDYSSMVSGAVEEFYKFFGAISADRKANPREDLISLIANAEIDGEPIGAREEIGYYIIAATAGHDTTSTSTARVMWALATVPGLLGKVRADLSLTKGLIEEAIRWETPVKTFMRSAAEDTEIRGQKISKGDWIMLCYASGNRDEEVFDNPYTFDAERKPNAQLAFGFGGHVCLGQHLARMEMETLFQILLPRLKSVELAGEPALIESWFVNGLKRLPISFEME